jgi:hypothetical protein
MFHLKDTTQSQNVPYREASMLLLFYISYYFMGMQRENLFEMIIFRFWKQIRSRLAEEHLFCSGSQMKVYE